MEIIIIYYWGVDNVIVVTSESKYIWLNLVCIKTHSISVYFSVFSYLLFDFLKLYYINIFGFLQIVPMIKKYIKKV